MSALVPLLVALPLLGAGIALVFGRRRVQVGVSIVTLTLVLAIAVGAAVRGRLVGAGDRRVGGRLADPVRHRAVRRPARGAARRDLEHRAARRSALLVGQGAADGDDDTPVTIFHPSYLILAAGIFNAFIAGDLFNLYVGFEILLVASYVLITLGSTESRIRTGVVYIVVSLVSSILFLAAIAAIYGALGTVNIAQLAERMTSFPIRRSSSCTSCCCSPSASRPPCSRCRSGCPTRTRPRRRPSPRCSRAC
jgi:multicomponent Na+:H+ antiporter subunit D